MKLRVDSSKFISIAASLLVILPMSPLLGSLFDINSSQLFSLTSIIVASILLSRGTERKAANIVVFLSCLFFALSALAAIYWQEIKYITLPAFYLPSMAIAMLMTQSEKLEATKLLTSVAVVLITGSIIGFLYALAGLPPFAETLLKDGRPSYFFPLTLTNVYIANLIRPSGIFDEAGALSFFVCSIVTLREFYGLNRKTSLFLLAGGLVTLSIAHLLFCLFYLLHVRNLRLIVICTAFILLLIYNGIGSNHTEFNQLFYDRFILSSEGIAGNNRLEPFINAMDRITFSNALWGIDPACMFDRDVCHQIYGYMGENPLSPMIFGGLFVSAVYYLGILYLMRRSLKGNNFFLLVGLLLLLLQRPYIATLGYSMLFFLVALYAHQKLKLNPSKIRSI